MEIDLDNISTELQQLITAEQAWHYLILPKEMTNDQIVFYIDETKNKEQAAAEIELISGRKVRLIPIEQKILLKAIGKYYRRSNGFSSRTEINVGKNDDFALFLIQEAKSIGSSDIHIEVYNEKCRVRYRLDGKLVEKYVIERHDYPALINKIKILANLDISEKRLPQDGRLLTGNGNSQIDIRVSVIPTMAGEKIVLRLLSKDSTTIDLKTLGFTEDQLTGYYTGIRKPYGIILVSGPTGSGKTTTLYGTLKLLNNPDVNILTIEDPIEYTLEGINQVQLNEGIGLTFGRTLRSFLRQDPDIIMLGEIRDAETAQMAIRAAMTGHLVLSTIHTNSAWGTINRLIDMNVPPYLISSTLILTVAQRLVRVLCPLCKEERNADENMLELIKDKTDRISFSFPVGCESCYYTGYHGRIALYEVIPIDKDLSKRIRENQLDVSNELDSKGIINLQQGARQLLEEGRSSFDELFPILIITE